MYVLYIYQCQESLCLHNDTSVTFVTGYLSKSIYLLLHDRTISQLLAVTFVKACLHLGGGVDGVDSYSSVSVFTFSQQPIKPTERRDLRETPAEVKEVSRECSHFPFVNNHPCL